MSEFAENKAQTVLLNNRNEIRLSGISSVDGFDEFRITATCNDGALVCVEGSGLCVKEVNPDNGIVEATGNITGFFFDERLSSSKGGLLNKLFYKR